MEVVWLGTPYVISIRKVGKDRSSCSHQLRKRRASFTVGGRGGSQRLKSTTAAYITYLEADLQVHEFPHVMPSLDQINNNVHAG